MAEAVPAEGLGLLVLASDVINADEALQGVVGHFTGSAHFWHDLEKGALAVSASIQIIFVGRGADASFRVSRLTFGKVPAERT